MAMAAQLGVILDSIIVGNLIDSNAMTSVGVCMPLNQVVAAVSVIISVGAGGLIAIASGARQHNEANKIFSTVFALSWGLGLLITAICVPFTHGLTHFLTSSEEMITGVHDYLHVFIFRFSFITVLQA